MDEIADFEGFTADDGLINLKCKRIYVEQIAKKNSVIPHFSTTKLKKIQRREKHEIPLKAPKLLSKRVSRTGLLKFWHVKEQYTFDTPHTVHDHAQWFEKVVADLGNDKDSKELQITYQQYTKLVSLESSVNATMFINDCSNITSHHLWKQLGRPNSGRVSKWWLKSTLALSPLFSCGRHQKVWERRGITYQGGKNAAYSIYIAVTHLVFFLLSVILEYRYPFL